MLKVLPLVRVAACDDVFGPWGVTGTYQLEAVNGRQIPAIVFQRAAGVGVGMRVLFER